MEFIEALCDICLFLIRFVGVIFLFALALKLSFPPSEITEDFLAF